MVDQYVKKFYQTKNETLDPLKINDFRISLGGKTFVRIKSLELRA